MRSLTLLALVAGPACAAPLPKEKDPPTPFVQWFARDEFAANEPHDPRVVKDRVIVGTDNGELRAYRCRDGELLWVHKHGDRIFHRPDSDQQRVYFTSARGLTAVKADTGDEVWRVDLPCRDGPLLVDGKLGLVFVGGDDGTLYALGAATGKQQWTAEFLTDAPADPPGFAGARVRGNNKARPTALATDGTTVFLGVFDQCRVVAFHAATGKRLWSFQTQGWVYGSAVATDKHVFIGSQDGSFYCLDKRTGEKEWKFETKGRVESGGSVDDKWVYFASCDGRLYCLDQTNGRERWRFAADPEAGRDRTAIYSVPVLRRDSVYFAAGEGQVYALERESGRLKGKVRPSEGSDMYCSLAADGDRLFGVTRVHTKGRGEPSLVAIGLK